MRPQAAVLGASSGVGRALAVSLARSGYDVIIAARRVAALEDVAKELRSEFGVVASVLPVDLTATDDVLKSWVGQVWEHAPALDALLLPAGAIGDVDDGMSGWVEMQRLVVTNFVSVAKIAGDFAARFEDRGYGTVVLFSSIAAGAPRSRNVMYAAAKAALLSYARSLQHRFAASNVTVQVYVLGYVDTEMARGRQLLIRPARPERVADEVVAHLHSRRRVRYVPRYWAFIVRGLRMLPWQVYRRLRF